MKSTTATRFGFGKSFQSPSAAAAVVGAALIASGTSDTAETAWSPAAACLLPDILPVAGTLLSYGGDRQLAAGGTVTHSVHTASTKGLILKTTDDSSGQPIFEVQNSIGSSLHRIQGSTAYFANVSAASGLTGTMVNVGSTGYVQWGSRSVAYAPAVGQFSFRNNDETAGATLDVTTDGTLAIKNRVGTATGNLSCAAITASGAIQETPTQSALDPTTTNIPSGKRQGWYNTALSEFRDWVNIGGTLLKSAAYT